MERQLIVMRHAKSSWESPASGDHERPLNDRGRQSAPRVAEHLMEIGWQPQHILSSDAQRTRETASLLVGQWEEGVGVDFRSRLYLAGRDELEAELQEISEEVESLLVLGHNPGWQQVVFRLSGHSITMKIATAALLLAECESWADAFHTRWSLESVVYPRDLA